MAIEFHRDGPWELPDGWVWVVLRHLVVLRGEKAPPDKKSPLAFIGMDDVPSNSLLIATKGAFKDMKSAGNKFYANDILYGRLRPYLNKVVVADFEGVASGEFIVMRPKDGIEPRYLQLWMHSRRFVNEATRDTSGDRPRIDFDTIAGLELPLPPTAEQKRIVSRVDELFTDIADGETALTRARGDLDTWRRALLKAAVTGELTRDWRERTPTNETGAELLKRIRQRRESLVGGKRSRHRRASRLTDEVNQQNFDIPESWCWTTWSDVGVSQNGRPFPSKDYAEDGNRLLRPGNLYFDGRVRWTASNTRYLPRHHLDDNPDLVVRGRELVINLTAQSLRDEFLGRVCITDDDERCLLNQRLARLTPIEILPEYTLIIFKSPLFRSFVSQLNSGSLIQHMFTSQIEEFAFPLPPINEQNAIVRMMSLGLGLIGDMAELGLRGTETPNHLRQAVLKAAFEGRLVEQSPRDELAEKLLARLSDDPAQFAFAPGRRGRRTRPAIGVVA